jgi:hypothetical protein
MVATVILTFDTYDTTYTNAFFDMLAKGIPGTFFANADRVGQAGYCSKDNMILMEANGWEIGAYAYGTVGGTDANMVSAWNDNRDTATDRLRTIKDEMHALDFDVKSVAASQRAWSTQLAGVASGLFSAARVADNMNYGAYPVTNKFYVRDGGAPSWGWADTAAGILARWDAIPPGGYSIEVIHRVDIAGDPTYTVQTPVFQAATAGLQSRIAAGTHRAVTFYNGLGA